MGGARAMAGIVPTNCIANILHSGSFSSGISLRPHTASCFLACGTVAAAAQLRTLCPQLPVSAAPS